MTRKNTGPRFVGLATVRTLVVLVVLVVLVYETQGAHGCGSYGEEASTTTTSTSHLRGDGQADASTIQEPDIHFHLLLDRSGSMSTLRHDVLGGINTYIADQQRHHATNDTTRTTPTATPTPSDATPSGSGNGAARTQEVSNGPNGASNGHNGTTPNIFFSLVQFDSGNTHDVTIDSVPILDVKALQDEDYQPRGATPLYNAIGGVIQRAEETVACNKGGKAELPVIIIFTDGEENRSMQWDRESVATLVRTKEEEGWTFVFLGANQDAFAEGGRVGLSRGSTQNYVPDTAGVRSAFSSMSKASRKFSVDARHAWKEAEQAAADAGVVDAGIVDAGLDAGLDASSTSEARKFDRSAYASEYLTKTLSQSREHFFEGNDEAQADYAHRTARGGGGGGDL